jgi:hypothetical protein
MCKNFICIDLLYFYFLPSDEANSCPKSQPIDATEKGSECLEDSMKGFDN